MVGSVLLRVFSEDDLPMALDLATDPYIPLIGTIPANADDTQAIDWIQRQLQRHHEGVGYSFAIADSTDGRGVGAIGLWLTQLRHGRATAGYSVAPRDRGQGYATDALTALTDFAWTFPDLHRVECILRPGTPPQFAPQNVLGTHAKD